MVYPSLRDAFPFDFLWHRLNWLICCLLPSGGVSSGLLCATEELDVELHPISRDRDIRSYSIREDWVCCLNLLLIILPESLLVSNLKVISNGRVGETSGPNRIDRRLCARAGRRIASDFILSEPWRSQSGYLPCAVQVPLMEQRRQG